MKALWIADREGVTPFVSNQLYYSLQARDIENELVPLAVDQGLGILVWSPIAGGLLSGKYRRGVDAPPGSRHLTDWSEPPVYDEDKLYDTVEELVAIGADHGVSAAQIALAYTLAKPAMTTVIVGARTEDQLADNLAAADLKLSAEEMDRLDKVSAQPLPYPFWHHAKSANDRLSPADLTLLGVTSTAESFVSSRRRNRRRRSVSAQSAPMRTSPDCVDSTIATTPARPHGHRQLMHTNQDRNDLVTSML